MGIFKSATEKLITKEVEYKLHERVVKDLTEGYKDLGVWGKAFVDADGDDKRTEAVYVKLMVQHYKDTAKSEAELEAIWKGSYQYAEAEKEKVRLREEKKSIEKVKPDKAKKSIPNVMYKPIGNNLFGKMGEENKISGFVKFFIVILFLILITKFLTV
ncbi:hypothetical protein N9X63_04035 [Woeseiaceae bacterium]|nr:hypothetical protein [Woeseiaceae bacterium]